MANEAKDPYGPEADRPRNSVLPAILPIILLLPCLLSNETHFLSQSDLGADYLATDTTHRAPEYQKGCWSGRSDSLSLTSPLIDCLTSGGQYALGPRADSDQTPGKSPVPLRPRNFFPSSGRWRPNYCARACMSVQ